MSMICTVLGISPSIVAAIREKPMMASALAQNPGGASIALVDKAESLLARMPPEQQEIVKARLAAVRAQLEAQGGAAAPSPQTQGLEPPLDLHKSWHLLHYVFSGRVDDAPPPEGELMGGEAMGQDLGYGPPHLHDVAATRTFADFLAAQTVDALQARIDLDKMDDIYVYGGLDDEEEIRDDLEHFFPRLRDYVVAMADKGYGLLIWLS
ncbi:MAG TPA: DUF1877 family protein [Caulobacteraceae bacterium]|jgi:hypothetical protein